MSFFRHLFKKRKIKLICFDLDNTLYDYSVGENIAEVFVAERIEKLIKDDIENKKKTSNIKAFDVLKVFNEIKREHMHHDIEPEKFSRELWIKETIIKLCTELKKSDIDEKSLLFEKEYWSKLVDSIKMFPNTIKILDALKSEEKYKIATITDSDGKKDIKLDRIRSLGLEKYFDYIITTDDTKKNKPAIENWEYLLKISGSSPEECVMIGDHPEVDLISAKKLGFLTIWTKEHIASGLHYKYVDYEIRDIIEILEILKKYV